MLTNELGRISIVDSKIVFFFAYIISIYYFKFKFILFGLKYLSLGDDPGTLSITYSRLQIIELYQVSFEDMKEILVVLRLITNSPNLKELQISVSYFEHVGIIVCDFL